MAFKLSSFLAELKRRKVYQVAAAYVAVGVAISVAVPDLFGAFGFPFWAAPLLIVVLVLGFPVALVLAWAYEVRPEEPRIAEASSTPAAERTQRKSIVVLPFDNMSPDPGDSYLGDGLTEELTTKLSMLGRLRVISRNSAMALKGTHQDSRAISRTLGVQYLVEGSVRKAGEALRVTAQLIDGHSDEHLWAEVYEGTVEDIFGMQDELSRAILDALIIKLKPNETERFLDRRFPSFQGLQYYVRGMAEMWLLSETSLNRALEIADRGLAVVEENELLLVVRGMVFVQYINLMSKDTRDYPAFLEEARRCADRALTINPQSAPAHMLKAATRWQGGEMPPALSSYVKALQLDPNNPEALHLLGYFRAAGGYDSVGAWRLLEQLQAIDPLTPISSGAVGYVHWFNGEFDSAIRVWGDWWRAMDEARSPMRIVLAYFHAANGDIDEVVRIVERVQEENPGSPHASLGTFLKHAWRGDVTAAFAAVTQRLEEAARWDDIWPLFLASGYALTGEVGQAFYWLDRAVDWGISNVRYLGDRDPFLANLRSESQFQRVLEKAERVTQQNAAAAVLVL